MDAHTKDDSAEKGRISIDGTHVVPKRTLGRHEAATSFAKSPMRINKYLASKKYCTRREADEMIEKKLVSINGQLAVLGDKVKESDVVEVKNVQRKYRYFAYNKPRGIITHSPQADEESIEENIPLQGVFPVGRLDKDSYGLIILTDDGRITDPLLNPEHAHEKEYEVATLDTLPADFKRKMESGIDIGGYVTKPCKIEILGDRSFSITLQEGKKHQIRRMCGALGQSAMELERVRIMNINLGRIRPGEYRSIKGIELEEFLKALGI
jgi:23S rRNA pseudouridine2604 synthase